MKIEIPDYFNPEWYILQKELNKSDEVIAEELMISLSLLYLWKRERGCAGLSLVEKFPIPEFFTPEWYVGQKNLRKNDFDIAEELMISKQLLDIWKRERNCVGLITKPLSGRKSKGDMGLAIKLYRQGINRTDASKEAGVTLYSLNRHLRLEGLLV